MRADTNGCDATKLQASAYIGSQPSLKQIKIMGMSVSLKRRRVDPTRVAQLLAQVESRHQRNAVTAIVGGSVLCALSVLILAVLWYVIPGTPSLGSFKDTYAVMAVVGLPLLFLLAYKLQGSVLEATVPGNDFMQNRFVARQVMLPLVMLETANAGPRLVLWGVQQVRGRGVFAAVPHARLGTALTTLLEADGSIPPAQLLLPGEPADQLEPLLGVLLLHELADLSKNADRVWATSKAKGMLAATAD